MKDHPFATMEAVSRACTRIYYGFLGFVWISFTTLAVALTWKGAVPGRLSVLLFVVSAGLPVAGALMTRMILAIRAGGTGGMTRQLQKRHGGTVLAADWRNLFRTDHREGEVLGLPVSVRYARIPKRGSVEQIVSGQFDGGSLLSRFLNSREYWQLGRGRYATQTVRVELPPECGESPLILLAGRTRIGEAAGRHLRGRLTEIHFPGDPVAQAFIITSSDPAAAEHCLTSTSTRQILFAAASWCAPLLASVRMEERTAVFSGYVTPRAGPDNLQSLVELLAGIRMPRAATRDSAPLTDSAIPRR